MNDSNNTLSITQNIQTITASETANYHEVYNTLATDGVIYCSSDMSRKHLSNICEYIYKYIAIPKETITDGYEAALNNKVYKNLKDYIIPCESIYDFEYTCNISDTCIVYGEVSNIIELDDGYVFYSNSCSEDKLLIKCDTKNIKLNGVFFCALGKATILENNYIIFNVHKDLIVSRYCEKNIAIENRVIKENIAINKYIYGLSDYDNLEIKFKKYKLKNFRVPLVFTLVSGLILGGALGITINRDYMAFKAIQTKNNNIEKTNYDNSPLYY